jgi:DNA polymerase-3 subunit gamma/tau
MPGQALYSKYRPQTFDEIEGQEHIKTTLKSAIALNRIAHAYLFTGPRGTGKTTTARVLAKAVSCLAENNRPCNTCATCQAINEGRMLDLIEIDAASNTSVDDIRDLRDKVDFRPGEARFKVYIIDEVHMLSNAAFNALLKTLEEPPPHVIFVLATTDPQKIPATVISRVQRFDFRRLTLPEIVARLNEIASRENIKIEPDAVELIARQATGAMRDAISLLDQLMSYGSDEISLIQVQGLLGASSEQTVNEIVARLAERDVAQGLATIASAVDNGADPRQLARETVEYIRALMMIKMGGGASLTLTQEAQKEMLERAQQFSSDQLVRAIRLFNQAAFELRTSAHPTLPLEIAFVEATMVEVAPAVTRSVLPPPPAPLPSVPKNEPANSKPVPRATPQVKSEEKAATEIRVEPSSAVAVLSLDQLLANWGDVLARVRVYNKVTEALLRGAEPIRVEGDLIVLGFHYQNHAERFEKQPDGKSLIEKALNEIFHQKCRIKCILSPKKAKRKAVEEDPLISAAINQLGAEVTEIHDEPGA